MSLTVFSFGGGVQSTAALVLAARGELPVDAFLFANVGDDSENPATLRYVREIAMPYAAAHGINLVELQRRRKTGEAETLYGRLTRPGSRSIGIPVRIGHNGMPAPRACTVDFKIKVISSWCRQHGARKTKPAITMIGISLDEFQRMRTDSGISYTRLAYPLVERRMSRQDCINVIALAGLPIPPKSSCWFCPFHSLTTWREMRDKEPAQFYAAAALEEHLNVKGVSRNPLYLTRSRKPLVKAIGDASQPSLFEDDVCESGYCMV